jgi:dCTP deaminase
MILSDKSIQAHLGSSRTDTISADPMPDDKQIQPASLDVRLGEEVYSFSDDKRRKGNFQILEPGERYLGHTKETITLPNHIAAQLAGRSSVGRMGVIVHKTAGWIDPGFSGEITLELMNLGEEAVNLQSGSRVAQLVFFELDHPSMGYDGSYQQQEGATKSR